MPIRKLDEYLRERNLVAEVPLASLSGVRIGVDGNAWLKAAAPVEPFHVAIGGPPLQMEAALLAAATQYREAGLKPVFVFHGLAVPRKDGGRGGFAQDVRFQMRNSGWEFYYKAEIAKAAAAFAASEKSAALNYLVPQVVSLLSRERFDWFRAPMLAWAQLAHFERTRLCHYVQGGSHLLMSGCERVVLDIDFVGRTARVVELRRVLEDLGVASLDHFLDMCVLAGFDYNATFPPLLEGTEFSFRAAADVVKRHRGGLFAVQAHAHKPQVARINYTEAFLTARTLVRHMLVLETNGQVAPQHRESAPRDLHEVVGVHLPDEVFALVSLGIINTQQLNNIMSGVLLEAPPLVDSDEYRSLLDELADARAAALGIIIAELNEYYQQRPIVTARWYAPNVDLIMNHAAPRLAYAGFHPRARGDLLAQAPHVSVGDVARLLAKPAGDEPPPLLLAAPAAAAPPTPAAMLAEAVGAPIVKLLVMRGYAAKGGATNAWGRALARAPSEFGDEAMLVLELLRLGLLDGNALRHHPPESTPPFDNEQQVRLLTRVFSLLACDLRAEAWEGPLDHDLLGFNSLVKALHRTLRNVLEAELTARVLRRELAAPVSAYAAVAHNMPFRQESNTALGIVLKHLLLQPHESVTSLAPTFANCVDIGADLRRGRTFWRAIFAAVRDLAAAGELPADTLALFESADQLINNVAL